MIKAGQIVLSHDNLIENILHNASNGSVRELIKYSEVNKCWRDRVHSLYGQYWRQLQKQSENREEAVLYNLIAKIDLDYDPFEGFKKIQALAKIISGALYPQKTIRILFDRKPLILKRLPVILDDINIVNTSLIKSKIGKITEDSVETIWRKKLCLTFWEVFESSEMPPLDAHTKTIVEFMDRHQPFPEITQLDLRSLGLTGFPDKFLDYFPNLKSLDLSDNKLVFFKLKNNNLIKLTISDNKLTKIPELDCPKLQTLILDNNCIRKINYPIKCVTLEQLKLNGNLIESISEVYAPLLNRFEVTRNPLTQIADCICPELSTLLWEEEEEANALKVTGQWIAPKLEDWCLESLDVPEAIKELNKENEKKSVQALEIICEKRLSQLILEKYPQWNFKFDPNEKNLLNIFEEFTSETGCETLDEITKLDLSNLGLENFPAYEFLHLFPNLETVDLLGNPVTQLPPPQLYPNLKILSDTFESLLQRSVIAYKNVDNPEDADFIFIGEIHGCKKCDEFCRDILKLLGKTYNVVIAKEGLEAGKTFDQKQVFSMFKIPENLYRSTKIIGWDLNREYLSNKTGRAAFKDEFFKKDLKECNEKLSEIENSIKELIPKVNCETTAKKIDTLLLDKKTQENKHNHLTNYLKIPIATLESILLTTEERNRSLYNTVIMCQRIVEQKAKSVGEKKIKIVFNCGLSHLLIHKGGENQKQLDLSLLHNLLKNKQIKAIVLSPCQEHIDRHNPFN